MEGKAFSIKGVREGLLIQVDPAAEWTATTADLAAHLDEQGKFYEGGRIILEVGERPVPRYELTSLKALLERRGLSLWAVLSRSETTRASTEALDLRTSAGAALASLVAVPNEEQPTVSAEASGTGGILIRHTIRSGSVVRSEGHVVVYGDINPGAEVVANGDVVVWGRLRGNVHAGSNGDESSVVCALDMEPMQLRIANLVVTSPADNGDRPQPEVALVRDGSILVESW